MAKCPAVAIWLLPVSELGHQISSPGNNLEPLPPRTKVFEFIPAADFRRKVGQPEGEPIPFLIAPADVSPERLAMPASVPKQHISMPPGYVKPGQLCQPATSRLRAIVLTPEGVLKEGGGHSLRGTLPAPPPFPCEPRTETKWWQAAALKPFQPSPSGPLPILLREQPGGFATMRPKQGLRELALPSPRPWQSLSILWQSLSGFHFAMPTAEAKTEVRLDHRPSFSLWKSCTDAYLPGPEFLQESSEVPLELHPLLEATRTPLSASKMVEAVAPILPGLKEPVPGTKACFEAEPFPQAPVSEMLPLTILADRPLPVIALDEGLLIWTESTNSYVRRNWRSPKLREGGREIQTLQLGPAAPEDVLYEISTI